MSAHSKDEGLEESFTVVWDRVMGATTPTMVALRKKLSAHDLRMLLLVALDMPVIEHEWFRPEGRPYDCCKNCGIVRRRDGLNSACKGHVKVSLRSTSAAERRMREVLERIKALDREINIVDTHSELERQIFQIVENALSSKE